MEVLQYANLDLSGARDSFERTVEQLRSGCFHAADVKKLSGTPFYRAKLNRSDRLLFRFGRHRNQPVLLLLEIIYNHAYSKSRFLNGVQVDEGKLAPIADPQAEEKSAETVRLNYVNPKSVRFHLLDKVLSFDDMQDEIFRLSPPLIIIGSAGSGKTALMLEKLKLLGGTALYVTLSPFLAENARNLFYANHYENDQLEVDFLSYRELLETILVPDGRELTFREFERWFSRHRHASRVKDAHKLFEEFRGVLTGWSVDRAHLSQDDYVGAGVRQSVFPHDERAEVYSLFSKYLAFVRESGFYDTNILSWQYLPNARTAYDFAVIDEVQDLTNVQLYLILKHLRKASDFIMGGDANQIVHPNFFSWAHIKTLFYLDRVGDGKEIIRILHTNYRNSPQVTEIANRLLVIKNARFGSIDRESNYLVRCISENQGERVLLSADPSILQELNAKTRKSTHFAVLVLRQEDKTEARAHFKTPLVFSIQEAKGLEYENIVLFNFVSGSAMEFREIIDGVEKEDIPQELKYARAKDKSDRSADAYKFFINALYVAVTRAVRNLYIVEQDHRHRLLDLLGLRKTSSRIKMVVQESSREDWEREARRLEMQGKQEQAELIRTDLLGHQAVPWRVLDPETLEDLKTEAFDPKHYNKQAKQQLFEYALVYSAKYLLPELARLKFNRAVGYTKADLDAILRKYQQDYKERGYPNLKRKLQLYGIDFRNALNQTPLMIAAQMGLSDLAEALLNGGADRELRDNWGRTPFQIALRQAYLDPVYAANKIGPVYELLAPSNLKVKVETRLIKLDRHKMEFFLLHSMLAVFQDILREKIEWDVPAFETGDFVFALEHFPEPVIPERRRTRPYISGVLSRNEIWREDPANRRLFVRVRRGFYLPNPRMEIAIGDRWANLYDVINLDSLEQEREDEYLLKVIAHIKKLKSEIPRVAEGST